MVAGRDPSFALYFRDVCAVHRSQRAVRSVWTVSLTMERRPRVVRDGGAALDTNAWVRRVRPSARPPPEADDANMADIFAETEASMATVEFSIR